MTSLQDTDTHHESVDITRPSREPRVLMVVATPATEKPTTTTQLITGQQRYSGTEVARLVIESLGV